MNNNLIKIALVAVAGIYIYKQIQKSKSKAPEAPSTRPMELSEEKVNDECAKRAAEMGFATEGEFGAFVAECRKKHGHSNMFGATDGGGRARRGRKLKPLS